MALTPPALDPSVLNVRIGSGYPAPFKAPCEQRVRRQLGDALGLTQFGVNLVELAPGAWSAQRHWHTGEDEFIQVVSGELTLVTDEGAQTLQPGQCAGFPAGREDGHHLVNRTAEVAVYLEVGTRVSGDVVEYPDIDLRLEEGPGGHRFTDKSGNSY